jgi:hypothetical protein
MQLQVVEADALTRAVSLRDPFCDGTCVAGKVALYFLIVGGSCTFLPQTCPTNRSIGSRWLTGSQPRRSDALLDRSFRFLGTLAAH